MLIAKILDRADKDIFELREDIDDNVKNSSKFKIRKEQYAQNFCEIRTDTELFESRGTIITIHTGFKSIQR